MKFGCSANTRQKDIAVSLTSYQRKAEIRRQQQHQRDIIYKVALAGFLAATVFNAMVWVDPFSLILR